MAYPGPATATSRRVCLTVVLCFMSVTPNWHEFAESLGYAAAGAAMILMLCGPREPGPGMAT